MGIRMSVGASAGDVIRLVIGGGMSLVLVGGGIGLALAAALSTLVSGFLYGGDSLDPVTFLAVPVVLGLVALAAAYLPARRASRVNPVEALRYD